METKRNNLKGLLIPLAGSVLASILAIGTHISDKAQGIERIYSGPVAECYTIDKDGDGKPDERVERIFVGAKFPCAIPIERRYEIK